MCHGSQDLKMLSEAIDDHLTMTQVHDRLQSTTTTWTRHGKQLETSWRGCLMKCLPWSLRQQINCLCPVQMNQFLWFLHRVFLNESCFLDRIQTHLLCWNLRHLVHFFCLFLLLVFCSAGFDTSVPHKQGLAVNTKDLLKISLICEFAVESRIGQIVALTIFIGAKACSRFLSLVK